MALWDGLDPLLLAFGLRTIVLSVVFEAYVPRWRLPVRNFSPAMELVWKRQGQWTPRLADYSLLALILLLVPD